MARILRGAIRWADLAGEVKTSLPQVFLIFFSFRHKQE